MNLPIHRHEQTAAPEDVLPPELVRIIEALAEAQARKDYAARFSDPEQA